MDKTLGGRFSDCINTSLNNKNNKNNLDRFLILVFDSPEEKFLYTKNVVGDGNICYIDGIEFELKIKKH